MARATSSSDAVFTHCCALYIARTKLSANSGSSAMVLLLIIMVVYGTSPLSIPTLATICPLPDEANSLAVGSNRVT